MDMEGWLQTGAVLLLVVGSYILIRRPLERKRLFDLAAGKRKRRRHARVEKELLKSGRH
jgi:hypothetical protein